MLPLPGIDGSKVWAWNKPLYVAVFIASIALAFGAMPLLRPA
jgi:Zn-dependent protease